MTFDLLEAWFSGSVLVAQIATRQPDSLEHHRVVAFTA
jgi:hypothetical protein